MEKMHNEEVHNVCASRDSSKKIKSRKMNWAGHVAWLGEIRNAYKILVGKPEGRRPLRRPSVDGRVILKWILEK
jgi:hypothetical protein